MGKKRYNRKKDPTLKQIRERSAKIKEANLKKMKESEGPSTNPSTYIPTVFYVVSDRHGIYLNHKLK